MVRQKWNHQSFEKKEEALRQKHWKERDALRKAMARGEFANYFDCSKPTFEGYCIETLVSVVKMLPVEKGIFNSEPGRKRVFETQ